METKKIANTFKKYKVSQCSDFAQAKMLLPSLKNRKATKRTGRVHLIDEALCQKFIDVAVCSRKKGIGFTGQITAYYEFQDSIPEFDNIAVYLQRIKALGFQRVMLVSEFFSYDLWEKIAFECKKLDLLLSIQSKTLTVVQLVALGKICALRYYVSCEQINFESGQISLLSDLKKHHVCFNLEIEVKNSFSNTIGDIARCTPHALTLKFSENYDSSTVIGIIALIRAAHPCIDIALLPVFTQLPEVLVHDYIHAGINEIFTTIIVKSLLQELVFCSNSAEFQVKNFCNL